MIDKVAKIATTLLLVVALAFGPFAAAYADAGLATVDDDEHYRKLSGSVNSELGMTSEDFVKAYGAMGTAVTGRNVLRPWNDWPLLNPAQRRAAVGPNGTEYDYIQAKIVRDMALNGTLVDNLEHPDIGQKSVFKGIKGGKLKGSFKSIAKGGAGYILLSSLADVADEFIKSGARYWDTSNDYDHSNLFKGDEVIHIKYKDYLPIDIDIVDSPTYYEEPVKFYEDTLKPDLSSFVIVDGWPYGATHSTDTGIYNKYVKIGRYGYNKLVDNMPEEYWQDNATRPYPYNELSRSLALLGDKWVMDGSPGTTDDDEKPSIGYLRDHSYSSKDSPKVFYIPRRAGKVVLDFNLDGHGGKAYQSNESITYDVDTGMWTLGDRIDQSQLTTVADDAWTVLDAPQDMNDALQDIINAGVDTPEGQQLVQNYVTNNIDNSSKVVNMPQTMQDVNHYQTIVTDPKPTPAPSPGTNPGPAPSPQPQPEPAPSPGGETSPSVTVQDFLNLPFQQLFPFCLVDDVRLLVDHVAGGAVQDGSLRFDFDIRLGSYSMPLVIDLEEYRGLQPSLHMAFDVLLVVGLLWFSISLFLKARPGGGD